MSATNRGGERRKLDAYYTPDELALAACRKLRALGVRPGTIIEPSVGQGAWVRGAREVWSGAPIFGVDVDPTAAGLAECDMAFVSDWPEWVAEVQHPAPPTNHGAGALVIGNPPYKHAREHVRAALDLAGANGTVAMLLRLSFLAPRKSLHLLWPTPDKPMTGPPFKYLIPLTPRPSFTGRGTDAAEYAIFVWRLTVQQGVHVIPLVWR